MIVVGDVANYITKFEERTYVQPISFFRLRLVLLIAHSRVSSIDMRGGKNFIVKFL